MKSKERKSLYFMPFLQIDETIEYQGIILKKNKGEFDDLMPDMFRNKSGVFIELEKEFQTGDYFNNSIKIKIHKAVEILKFSYYVINVPTGNGYPGFISDSTFEIFAIIEEHPDKFYEHKISITNGISNFNMSLNDYYQYKYILGSSHNLIITENSLQYLKYFYNSCINDEKKLSIIRLYNKCLRITDQEDYFDKIIFARSSIEVLVKIVGKQLNKQNYPKVFIEKVKTYLSNCTEVNQKIMEFYHTHIRNNDGLSKSEKNLENYLVSLKDIRDSVVHDNEVSNLGFMTIEVYITWFPLFFLIMLFEEKLQKKDTIRLILFLKLLQLDFKQWNRMDKISFPPKMSCLETYTQYSKYIAVQLEKGNSESVETYIKGFNSCFEN